MCKWSLYYKRRFVICIMFQDGGKGTSVFFYLSYHNTYLGLCRSDYDCQLMDPTKRRCMHGMCYECMTSADCIPPRTCDPPADGDGNYGTGTCRFHQGLLIISKGRWTTPSSSLWQRVCIFWHVLWSWDAELKIVSDKFALLWGEAQLCLLKKIAYSNPKVT